MTFFTNKVLKAFKIFDRLSQRTRNIITQICFIILFMAMWATKIIENSFNNKILFCFCTLATITIIIVNFTWIQGHKLNKKFIILIFIAMQIGIAGIYLKVAGAVAEGLTLGFILPIGYAIIIGRNINYYKLIDMMACAMCINFYVIILVSVFIAPWGDIRYRAILINSNTFAILLVAAFALFIFVTMQNGIALKKRYCYIFTTGLCGGFIIVTESRTAIICMILTLIGWMIFQIFNTAKRKEYIKSIIAIIAIIIVAIPGIIGILTYFTGNLMQFEESKFGKSFIIYDYQVSSEQYREITGQDGNDGTLENRFSDYSSSGRSDLWRIHLKNVKLYGHNEPIEFHDQTRTAHNSYIQLAYSYGIVCGISFLIFNCLIGIASLKELIRKKNDRVVWFRFMVVLIYGIYTMVETVYFPYYQHISFLFWVMIAPLLARKSQK